MYVFVFFHFSYVAHIVVFIADSNIIIGFFLYTSPVFDILPLFCSQQAAAIFAL